MERNAFRLVAALVPLLTSCASLPSLEGRMLTTALEKSSTTRIGQAVGPPVAANPGKTGIHTLPRALDAFAARAVLAAAADRSLDVQYYIWHGDQTGTLLFESLWQAAERGVRVRLLLDDNNTAGLDPTIAALDGHRNIEVRLYNPLVHRGLRALNFITDFTRVNRRMHNKSFTVDNALTIVGGRNIGDEYFGAGGGVGFMDLDVIAVGAAVPAVSAAFDRYWNSPSAYPAERLVGRAGPGAAEELLARFAATRADPQAEVYLASLRDAGFVSDLIAGRLSLTWANAQLLVDDPAKTLDTTGRRDVLLLSALLPAVGRPAKSFDLVSPYFVPGDGGTEALAGLARAGVRVRVLTNSLAATDVSAVHAGYAKRRDELLRAGVQLFELKPSAAGQPAEDRQLMGSSSASLHAKTFAIDRARIFVGSFNFDERSALLNTELGLLIDSEPLAAQLAGWLDSAVPQLAYEVRQADNGLQWIERNGAVEILYDSEPGAGALLRGWTGFLSILPIDWLL